MPFWLMVGQQHRQCHVRFWSHTLVKFLSEPAAGSAVLKSAEITGLDEIGLICLLLEPNLLVLHFRWV